MIRKSLKLYVLVSECSRAVFQCNNGYCLSLKYYCDGIADCPGKYLEDESFTEVLNSANRCQRLRDTHKSCEEWWSVGARNNGTYTLHSQGREKCY